MQRSHSLILVHEVSSVQRMPRSQSSAGGPRRVIRGGVVSRMSRQTLSNRDTCTGFHGNPRTVGQSLGVQRVRDLTQARPRAAESRDRLPRDSVGRLGLCRSLRLCLPPSPCGRQPAAASPGPSRIRGASRVTDDCCRRAARDISISSRVNVHADSHFWQVCLCPQDPKLARWWSCSPLRRCDSQCS